MFALRAERLVRDEDGGGTVWGLLWFMVLTAICGLAVDTTDSLRTQTGLQATADAAALAASIDLPNEANALATAQIYAELNMPSSTHGTVLRPEDVTFGIWDPDARTFQLGETPADAVHVVLHRSADNDNELPMNFLKIVGLSAWEDIRAEAVAQRFVPPCLRDGLFAREMVDVSSNNAFVENICIHGEQGVNMQNHNYFEDGVTVSMPDPDTMLTIPTGGMQTNPGLEQALKANSYSFAMVDDLPNIFNTLLNPETDTGPEAIVPNYVEGDPKDYDTSYTLEGLSESELKDSSLSLFVGGDGLMLSAGLNFSGVPDVGGFEEIWHIVCNPNETYNIGSNMVIVNIVIIADCKIHVGSGTILNNVVLASTAVGNGSKPLEYQNITFAADVQLGDRDNCAPGGGVQIYSAASVHFSSSMMINGLQVVAAGNVELGARDMAINGISVMAGKNITLTSNNMFGLCSGGSPTTMTKVSYRLVN